MKRRKWWLIALSLALLAACVGVWKWSTPIAPPFAFLGRARLLGFSLQSNSLFGRPTVVEKYSLDSDWREVEEVFRRTVAKPPTWKRTVQTRGKAPDMAETGYFYIGPRYDVGISELVVAGENTFSVRHPAMIVVTREGTWGDRIRSLLRWHP
jgi:hypothetical protein